MPAGIKPINCVGKKGRSGRKSLPVEFAKAQAIIKSWNKVSNEVDSMPVEKVALQIALRDMVIKSDNQHTFNSLSDLILALNGQKNDRSTNPEI